MKETTGAARRPESPLVSLILLSYQYERFVGRAIESVLAQTYPDWQLVVVDDGSRDGSLEIIRSYRDPRIQLLALGENRGAGHAYNRAYALCRGELVGSIDADDYLAPEWVERHVACFAEHPETDVVGTYVVQVGANGEPIEGRVNDWVNRPRDLNRPESWAMVNYICHSSVLLRRAAHDRVGALSTALELAPDFDLWLRCFVHRLRFHVIPEPLTYYRTHGDSVSDHCGRAQLFIELAYLYARYVAPDVAAGRPDILARSQSFFTSTLAEADPETRHAVLRAVAAGPLHARDPRAFIDSFPRRCGPSWPAAVRALEKGPRSLRAQEIAPAKRRSRRPRHRLAVVDNYFPEVTTSFRVAEFNAYLERFDCTVFSTSTRFEAAHRVYAELFPQHASRVRPFDPAEAADASLVYFTFLYNTHSHLAWLEANELPFLFTLYPGGGFQLFDPASDLRLSELGRSPLLRHMITTQRLTFDYVVTGGFCPPAQVGLIYGCVFPVDYYRHHTPARLRFPADKANLDICFVAFKYMAAGIDKGYDTFLTTARELARRAPEYRFHVVGNFTPADLPVDGLEGRITFHPPQPTPFFPSFYATMDMLISPNVPFRVGAGAFDGFPTGCATEAALSGVAVLCSDELHENEWFRAGEELCIVPPRADAIVERVEQYRRDSARLHRLAAAGQQRCFELFGSEAQLAPRCELIASFL